MAEYRNATFLTRREMLAAAGAALAVSGCRSEPEASLEPTAKRSDVPLKIVLVGTDEDAEGIRRAWMSVDEQPLEISVLAASRTEGGEWMKKLTTAARACDVVIYPMFAVSELMQAETLVPISDDQFEAMEEELGSVLSAPRNGSARYGGQYVAMPLGARLPGLLSTREVPELTSWADYDGWVASELDGKAAEPLAAGWAAVMYLWRAVSSVPQGWLFSREDFRPTIDSDEYVDVLEQMANTVQHYKPGRLTPEEIWEGIRTGDIAGGIGFPTSEMDSDVQVTISDLPGGQRVRMMLDPFSPVVSLSSYCRQSATSKRLMNWLSAGEGSQLLRRQVSMITATRTKTTSVLATEPQADNPYEAWLIGRLGMPVTVPSLPLLAASEYYETLDDAVGRTLDGKIGPKPALAEVAEKWQAITQRVGKEKQQSAWRRAQGLRA
ncbi:hypothetical protein [Planctomycetes bacterium CA13]|uniref:hypothetical protein n=1 Tax=Novipirellula herctigrandis TaxID=2527986 RepID=UPI0011B71AE4